MTIRRVRADNKDIRFNHTGDELLIILDKPIGWDDKIDVRIDYSAKPLLGTFFFSNLMKLIQNFHGRHGLRVKRQTIIIGYLFMIIQMIDPHLKQY